MTEYLTLPTGRIAYDVTGEGPLVVMAPGMGDVRGAYRFVVPELVAAGYRVAVFDIRGHGDSSTDWDAYTTSAVGGDYAALIRHLGGGPAIVVGQSFTPDSAVHAAAEAPELVAGLVLIAPFAAPPRLNPLLKAASALVTRVPALWGMFYTSLYKGPKPADFKPYVSALKANLRRPHGTRALVAMGDPATKDSAAQRAQVEQPALVVMGTKDTDFPDPAAEAEQFAGDLAGPTRIAMIEGAGHYPHAQYPAETTAAILAFLAQTAKAARG
ncbi:alpha/beta fold hydrolase [Streptomyces polyrhachis]|uniref:Alpha/beta fold hydrolase n=1 Tax=Streptomyces polyrhachis TaxID=1282885 RepID=A0ABW2GHM0_9ACTN